MISPTTTQNLTTVALAVPEIIPGVRNSKIGQLTLTTPNSGIVGHLKVITSRAQNLKSVAVVIPKIFHGV